MKRMLIVCLLGMGLLLPYNKITAKEFFTKRIVDVYKDGWALHATSDDHTGNITTVRIFNGSGAKVLQQSCSGYSCTVSLVGLPAGDYTAQVTTSMTVYTETFTI